MGASTCASGSQVCTGHMGIFTANEAKKASHSHICRFSAKPRSPSISTVMSAVPWVNSRVMIATSISTEPTSV